MKKKFYFVVYLVFVGIASRLVPHPWNFTAIGAMALFSGVSAEKNIFSVFFPILALFISDWIIGFHNLMIYTYFGFFLVELISYIFYRPVVTNKLSSTKKKLGFLGLVSVISSLVFFLVTNFGVWQGSTNYPKDFTGLVDCYVFALPFLDYQIFGDIFYSFLFYASFEFYVKTFLSQNYVRTTNRRHQTYTYFSHFFL